MKKSIYFGNITSHLANQPSHSERPYSEVSTSTLTFSGFDLSAVTGFDHKLDLLFYNRVNELGEVLSSLVYISNILSNDVTDKVYDVKKLYVNTDAEKEMKVTSSLTDFTYFNCKWASSNFFTESISPLSDVEHEELAVNENPSIKLEASGITFDGWYTQVSVGVRVPTGTITRDLVGFYIFSDIGEQLAICVDPSNPNDDASWSPYTTILQNGTTNPDGSILIAGSSLANLLVTTSEDNPYIKQDLFVLPVYLDIYDSAVIQYAEFPTYGNPFPVLRDKHRIIHNFAENNQFLEAQYILQTTEYSRLTAQK